MDNKNGENNNNKLSDISKKIKNNSIIPGVSFKFDLVSLLIWGSIGLAIIFFLVIPFISGYNVKEVRASELAATIKEEIGNDREVLLDIRTDVGVVEVKLANGDRYQASYKETDKTFLSYLQEKGVNIESSQLKEDWKSPLIKPETISTLIIVGVTVFGVYMILKTIQSSGSKMNAFGKSTAKLFTGEKTEVTFDDVAGVEEAKQEVEEVVDFLKEPKKYFEAGARIPKGVLLVGPPGVGKTLLAKAVAGEAEVPFFHTSGSEFEEMLVGAGAARVRDMFKKAKRLAPCIIFIDEMDAIAKKRQVSLRSSYTEQTLNQILVEMDGFKKNDRVIVLAATNRPDILDPAILRPGRFDRKVIVEKPDQEGRKEIIKVHAKGKSFVAEVDFETLAKRTVGMSGADLENVLNEAAIIAAKQGRKKINQDDLDEASLKVLYGPRKKSKKKIEEDLWITANHEAGHAIVSYFTDGADPVHKISIISRGLAMGMTMNLPEEDRKHNMFGELTANIRVLTAGRIAEEIMIDEISAGASNDIKEATKLARKMVKELGMGVKTGFVKYGESVNEYWLGYSYEQKVNYSEKYAAILDEEVKKIIDEEYKQAKNILTKHKDKLKGLAEMLMKKEVITREEFEDFMEGKSEHSESDSSEEGDTSKK